MSERRRCCVQVRSSGMYDSIDAGGKLKYTK